MKILITAGPTREPIDPVRFLSNRSSGKMGYALAGAARYAGHQVTLISGPVCLEAPPGVETVPVVTSEEMYEAVHSRVTLVDACILCAAVADYRPASVAKQKIKKRGDDALTLRLIPTRDILPSLGKIAAAKDHRKPVVVGFAAETNDVLENGRRKLKAKGCSLLVVNDVSRAGIGFESGSNEVTLLFASGEERVLPLAPKEEIAQEIIKIMAELINCS